MNYVVLFLIILVLSGILIFGYSYYKLTSYRISGPLSSNHYNRIIAFDFDGTVADSFDLLVDSYNKIAHEYNAHLIDEPYKKELQNQGPHEILKKLGVSPWQLPFIGRRLKKEMAQHIDEVLPFPDIEKSLRKLDKQYYIGLITSNSQENIRPFLKKHKLDAFFKFIISDVGAFAKPKALNALIRQAQTPKDHILYIGDEHRDGQAAKEVGIPFGAVTYGFNSLEALKPLKPTLIFESPLEIAPKIFASDF